METIIDVNETIHLTEVRSTDTAALVRFCNDPEIYANTLTFPKEYTTQSAEDFIKHVMETQKKTGRQMNWAIRLRKEDLLIGGIGLVTLEGDPPFKAEIGYWLAKPFRGQGWMTEIVSTFTEFCFNQLQIVRVFGRVYIHNPSSMKVLEKAGFDKEGVHRKEYIKDGRFLDSVLYAKINPLIK